MTNSLRSCDGCAACCTVLGVEEIGKPVGVKCAHVAPVARPGSLKVLQGCGVYETRPESCRGYGCLWMADGEGKLTRLANRPDKVGIVFDLATLGEHPHVAAREVWPGAIRSPAGQELITKLASRGMLIVLVRGGRPSGLAGPEDAVRKHEPWLREMQRRIDEDA